MKVAIYMRVSTKDQELTIQREELLAYCTYKKYTDLVVFEDKLSGTNSNRRNLIELKSRLSEFDIVLIWKIDRLFRSLIELLNTIEMFKINDVTLISLKENINMGTKEGRLMIQILGSFAEYEVEAIRERVKAGVQNYIKKNGHWGQEPTIDRQRVLMLHRKGHTQREIAKLLNTSKTTIQRILKK